MEKATTTHPHSPQQAAEAHPGTWNTPEAIAEHRALSAEQRIALAIKLSQTAFKLAAAERLDGR